MAKKDVVELSACQGPCADGEGMWLLYFASQPGASCYCSPCLRGFIEHFRNTEPAPGGESCWFGNCAQPAYVLVGCALEPATPPMVLCDAHVAQFIERVEQEVLPLFEKEV